MGNGFEALSLDRSLAVYWRDVPHGIFDSCQSFRQ